MSRTDRDKEKSNAIEEAWYAVPGQDLGLPIVDLNIESEGGTLRGTYDPNTALIGLYNSFGRMVAATSGDIEEYARANGCTIEEVRDTLREHSREKVKVLFEQAAGELYKQIQPKIEEAIKELCNQLLVQAVYDAGMQREDANSKADALNGLDRRLRKERNQRLGIGRGGSVSNYDLTGLSEHYSELLPQWRDAKNTYTSNQNKTKWRTIVKAAYPNFPDDLIARLKMQGDNSPSALAYEHAARRCGVPDSTYTTRALQKAVKEQRGNDELQRSCLKFVKTAKNGELQK